MLNAVDSGSVYHLGHLMFYTVTSILAIVQVIYEMKFVITTYMSNISLQNVSAPKISEKTCR